MQNIYVLSLYHVPNKGKTQGSHAITNWQNWPLDTIKTLLLPQDTEKTWICRNPLQFDGSFPQDSPAVIIFRFDQTDDDLYKLSPCPSGFILNQPSAKRTRSLTLHSQG